MDEYIFLNKQQPPSDEKLKELSPRAYKIVDGIREYLASKQVSINIEWKFYSSKSGWTMKMLAGKRNLLFCTPLKSSARVSFIFGDKAVDEVINSTIPQNIKDELTGAKKYAEGRGIAVQAKTKKDLENVLKLLEIKCSVK